MRTNDENKPKDGYSRLAMVLMNDMRRKRIHRLTELAKIRKRNSKKQN